MGIRREESFCRRNRIKGYFESGVGVLEIAELEGISRQSVYNNLFALGLWDKPLVKSRVLREKVKGLYLCGRSIDDLSKKFKLSRSLLRYWFRNDVECRKLLYKERDDLERKVLAMSNQGMSGYRIRKDLGLRDVIVYRILRSNGIDSGLNRRLELLGLRRRIRDLYNSGMGFDEIAIELGVHVVTVKRWHDFIG